MRRVTNTNLLFCVNQSLNRALPSWKCSIKAPAKYKTSIYVWTEICLQVNDCLRNFLIHFQNFLHSELKIHFLKRHLMLTFAKFKSFGHLFMHTLRFKVGRNPKKCVCNLGNLHCCLHQMLKSKFFWKISEWSGSELKKKFF